MGLLRFILGLFGFGNSKTTTRPSHRRKTTKKLRALPRLRYHDMKARTAYTQFSDSNKNESVEAPYLFARKQPRTGKYCDLSLDQQTELLERWKLPHFGTPLELADWLGLPVGNVAWLAHRFSDSNRPTTVDKSHYFYRWIRKRPGSYRLIESPKQLLKEVQHKILHEILDHISPHPQAHGFVRGRSIISNARPHVGQAVILKFDLENFYTTISFARVVAIFRSLGYSREAAIWLGYLTTTKIPAQLPAPENNPIRLLPFHAPHLPQGAPTSPAIANLSAFSLDVRLSGLARSFGINYTRYADDLTFSGSESMLRSLNVIIPLVQKIVKSERFKINKEKRRIIRANQRQTVTGVVVNEKTNVSRKEYDQLKAILHNCKHQGPGSQNRDQRPDFAAHLLGRIAHVSQLNSQKGDKLRSIYDEVDWPR